MAENKQNTTPERRPDCVTEIRMGNTVLVVCHTARALVAGVCAAVDKMFPLCLHHSVFLLAHGTADIICLPERKACQLPEDLHDLFLIDDAAIGHIQNVRSEEHTSELQSR